MSWSADRYELPPLRNRAAADEWALVLNASGIDCRIEQRDHGLVLSVAAADTERATAALSAYTRERRPARLAIDTDTPRRDGTLAGLLTAVSLPLFHAVTTVWLPSRAWTDHGSGAATHILRGEWWRVVTALTLHADWSHVVNNAVAAALFATGVCRWFGAGVGLWLIFAAGAGGNTINAYVRGEGHVAIGFSTAVFGAVGVLTTLQLSRRSAPHTSGLSRMRAWAPLAAGLALLALLGSSRTSDVGAHFFGFLCGATLGFIAHRVHAEQATTWLQAWLVVTLVLSVVACWWLAL